MSTHLYYLQLGDGRKEEKREESKKETMGKGIGPQSKNRRKGKNHVYYAPNFYPSLLLKVKRGREGGKKGRKKKETEGGGTGWYHEAKIEERERIIFSMNIISGHI